MISADDSINTLEFEKYYVIKPAQPWWDNLKGNNLLDGKEVKNGFVYSSDKNSQWLNENDLKKYINEL